MAQITRERIGIYLKTALELLNDNNGQLPSREVMKLTESQLNLTEYEKFRYEKTGYIRWQSILHFYSIDCIKAGWLIKKKGVWYITPEGVEALKLPPEQFIIDAGKKYKEWKQSQEDKEIGQDIPEEPSDEVKVRKSAYDQAVDLARDEIKEFLSNMDPYKFQDVVAALLRSMGYFTPFVAPKGKDGGIDILAYRDPFGTISPRIKVQVKHREQKATVQEVRQLFGLLNKDGDCGLFVSSSGFTSDALDAMLNNSKHIEKVDLDTLIDLWEEYYSKMSEEDKSLLPLSSINFLAPQV